MATNIVLPSAIAYQNMLIENISGLTDIFGKDAKAMTEGQREVLAKVSESVNALHKATSKLRTERGKINKIEDIADRAVKYGSVVTPLIEAVGEHCATLERLVDNEIWPLPKFKKCCSPLRDWSPSNTLRSRNRRRRLHSGRLFSVLSRPDSPILSIRNDYQPASTCGTIGCHPLLLLFRTRILVPK